jgi:translation initiation factor IF-2
MQISQISPFLTQSNSDSTAKNSTSTEVKDLDDLISLSKLSAEGIKSQLEENEAEQAADNVNLESVTASDVDNLARKLFADGEISKGEMILMEFEKLKPQISQRIQGLFSNNPITNYQQQERFDLLQALENRASNTNNESERAELNTFIDQFNSANT